MTDFINPLLQWLNAHPQLAGFFIFLISAGESVAILGTIVPGTIMMTAIGTLAGAGIIPLWETILWATLGAIAGDGISYWIGHHFKDRLTNMWPFRTHPSLLRSGQNFFHKYGSMSVFIGRFVGPVRALVPLVAGMLGMRPLQFYIANIASAIGWAPIYLLPGILLGAASLELPPDIAMHVMLVLLLITLFVLLCLWFIYKFCQLVSKQFNQLQNYIWRMLKEKSLLGVTTFLLKHHNSEQPHGQLNLALLAFITGLLFICLSSYIKLHGAINLTINHAIFYLFRSLRSPSIDSIMLNITLLGQKEVILSALGLIILWFVAQKRWRVAAHLAALGVFAASSVFVLKNIICSPRPWGIFQSPETYSMPSGHTTLSTAIYMGLAFLIASAIKPKKRWPIYCLGLILVLLISLSRLYLGAHWFTDVISSWLLSAFVLMIVMISYQRKYEAPINPWSTLAISILACTLTFSVFHHFKIHQLETNYAQIETPNALLSMSEWWDKNDALPAYKTSLFGFPTSPINLVWAGNIETIRDTLENEGWSKPPARDWISTLHRLADIRSTQYLPLVSPQYLDKKPALTLTRPSSNGKGLLVVRLWNASRTIKETNMPLWVGTIGIIPSSYSWLFKKHPSDIHIDAGFVFPNQAAIKKWEWKTIDIDQPTGSKQNIHQTMLLIRAK